MPRTDPVVVMGFCLEGDDGRKYFVKNAAFPTTTSLIIEISPALDRQFIAKIGSGLPPFLNGALLMLDSSSKPAYIYEWCNTTLMQVAFPAFDASLSELVTLTVTLGVVNVQLVTEDPYSSSGGDASTGTNTNANRLSGISVKTINSPLSTRGKTRVSSSEVRHSGRRQDPMVAFLFVVKIDGIDTPFLKRIDPLSVGQGGTYTLVLTGSETNITPFRTWLTSGGKKAGKIEYLDTSMKVAYRSEFTGLSIQSIYPVFPSGGNATVTMTFDSMIFYPV